MTKCPTCGSTYKINEDLLKIISGNNDEIARLTLLTINYENRHNYFTRDNYIFDNCLFCISTGTVFVTIGCDNYTRELT